MAIINDLLRCSVANNADRVALRTETSEVSYSELGNAIAQLADALAGSTTAGARVGILGEVRPEFAQALFAAALCGRIAVPLNYRSSPRELAYLLDDAGPELLLVAPAYESLLAEALNEASVTPKVVVVDDGQTGESELHGQRFHDFLAPSLTAALTPLAESPPDESSDRDVGWIIYTSGTTGRPKGVALSHRSLFWGMTNWAMGLGSGSAGTTLMAFPLFHVAGSSGTVGALLRGSTCVLRRQFDPTEIVDLIAQEGIRDVPVVPTMLAMLLSDERFGSQHLPSVRRIMYGGSVISPAVLREALERFPGVEFVQGYGQTELSGNPLLLGPEDHRRAASGEEHLLRATGRPLPLSTLKLVDETGQWITEPGQVGELVVFGRQRMECYWNNPEATEEKLYRGGVRTGDLAYYSDGAYYMVDRLKDVIKSGGENIYCKEIEDVLASLDPIQEVAIVGVPDDTWGQRVAAAIVRKPASEADDGAIVSLVEERCRAELAGFKRPRLVGFFDALPKTPSGKVAKAPIKEAIVQRAVRVVDA